MAMPLGMTLVGVQMLATRNDMFSNVLVNIIYLVRADTGDQL